MKNNSVILYFGSNTKIMSELKSLSNTVTSTIDSLEDLPLFKLITKLTETQSLVPREVLYYDYTQHMFETDLLLAIVTRIEVQLKSPEQQNYVLTVDVSKLEDQIENFSEGDFGADITQVLNIIVKQIKKKRNLNTNKNFYLVIDEDEFYDISVFPVSSNMWSVLVPTLFDGSVVEYVFSNQTPQRNQETGQEHFKVSDTKQEEGSTSIEQDSVTDSNESTLEQG